MNLLSPHAVRMAVLLVLNVAIVCYVLPRSEWHCTEQARWLTLGMIWLYGAFLDGPCAVILGLIWLLGTIPCVSPMPLEVVAVVPQHEADAPPSITETFVSGSGEKRKGKVRKSGKARRSGKAGKKAAKAGKAGKAGKNSEGSKAMVPSEDMQNIQSLIARQPDLSNKFAQNMMNSLGLKSLNQKREAFQNQIKQINLDIKGLKEHFNERSKVKLASSK